VTGDRNWWDRNGGHVEALAALSVAVTALSVSVAACRGLTEVLRSVVTEKGPRALGPAPADAATVGQAIRAARRARGLSQHQVAQVLGLTQPSVSAWEQGKSLPAVGVLSPLSRLLGLDPAELLEMVAG
jgi:DNA-binding transcriptional regulator YiaG